MSRVISLVSDKKSIVKANYINIVYLAIYFYRMHKFKIFRK